MPKDAPEIMICLTDDVPKDIPLGYAVVYLEGLKAGRLNLSRNRFKLEIYTLQQKMRRVDITAIGKFRTQVEINELVLKRDIFLQGYRNGEKDRLRLKGGLG